MRGGEEGRKVGAAWLGGAQFLPPTPPPPCAAVRNGKARGRN